jgi:BirA family biotin operon repressor/biotin-[acetyl-CoA-carboxylase] ligase
MIGPSRREPTLLTVSDLERALAEIDVSAPVRADEVTGSTNATALRLAEAGSPEWSLVSTAHQTEGRGRLGRSWVDLPGRALMFSFVLRPRISPDRVGLLSLLAGASMATAAREVTGRIVSCKWPNDLVLDEGKAGGVLAEASVVDEAVRYIVVGVGVNLDPPPGVPDSVGLGDAPPRTLLTSFLLRFSQGYRTHEPSFAGDVRAAWLAVTSTIGREVEAHWVDGRAIRGRAVDLDDRGGLVLSTDEGETTVAFGEVRHLD